ncbi:MAG: CofH family radical SAM protein, partial [Bacteroidota bacterium]|nr:CofH family radical SAM protein [Bacteroidota bacterium]
MLAKRIKALFGAIDLSKREQEIAQKVLAEERITIEDGLFLFEEAKLHYLGVLASFVKKRKSKNKVFFNKNIHIEPTNICIYNCKFCSFKRKFGDDGAWVFSIEEMLKKAQKYKDSDLTEVHITGGVHPHYDVNNYCTLICKIKKVLPNVHIKAFTAVELDFMIKKARMTLEDGLKKLIECGLDSIPGGGAEIFDEKIRKQICHDKSDSDLWLKIHKTAHKLGISSNATILYGHVETYEHRIDHLNRLRNLQDETNGFNSFIPLKFRNFNNKLSHIPEVSVVEDMRNYAVSRIFLDNIPHLKAYWVMLGKQFAQMS